MIFFDKLFETATCAIKKLRIRAKKRTSLYQLVPFTISVEKFLLMIHPPIIPFFHFFLSSQQVVLLCFEDWPGIKQWQIQILFQF